ncbi:MAG: succinate dehydrogenase [Bacillota bacterium]|nr:succinate dehydrogenase [Bacillota bacterium]
MSSIIAAARRPGPGARRRERGRLRVSHFFWSRLHSLSGVVPVGVFLIFHLWANSAAFAGPAAYNRVVRLLESLPALIVVETLFIFIPILYHAIYGFVIMRSARYNVNRYPFARNWYFVLQRATGVIVFVFIVYHVLTMRFVGPAASFAKVASELSNPWGLAFYIVGILSATWHLANGFWLFGIDWGILVSPRAQQVAGWVLAVFFVALSVLGVGSAIAFVA